MALAKSAGLDPAIVIWVAGVPEAAANSLKVAWRDVGKTSNAVPTYTLPKRRFNRVTNSV